MNALQSENDRDNVRDECPNEISKRLKNLIGDRPIRETAKEWDISPSTLMNYLYKGTMPSAEAALKIGKANGVTVEWLLTGEGFDSAPALQIEQGGDEVTTMVIQSLGNEKLTQLATRIQEDGINSVLIDKKLLQIVKMMRDLPDEDLKEILLLVNEAQYCSIVGEKFKPTYNKKVSNG